MGDPAKADPGLPPEIADALEAGGFSPKLATLMSIIAEFQELKAKTAEASEPVEKLWPLMKLLPVDVDYQKALRAAKNGQLEAKKIGGRWFCAKLSMDVWLAKTGQGAR